MKKVLYIIFIPLISLTITSCGFFSRMTDAYLPYDEKDLNTFFLLVAIGILYKIYDYFTKDE